jgi:DNA-binding CsgD family transcriptional regulator
MRMLSKWLVGTAPPRLYDRAMLNEEGVQSLSARESEVLEMASHGLTNLEIGSRLGVSVHAVKFHLAAVYRKLGVHNRTEAVVLYVTAMRAPTREVS